ncbi:MAG: tRNA uridine-5-carboxymethylaminomethyl(34) synthesis GTPase MnmE [Clostridiales bacterium]|nr:tRNA uridine-5-carboxymethylaminomethyl(34) synthesis GTPase MnmE [Clostridiales bacterium]
MNTIVQISTPLGSGGISVIRMSGKNSLQIANSIFSFKNKPSVVEPRHMYFGSINYEGFTEQCLMVYFKAPFSYTGEDVVEFQCHGGEYLTSQILNACLKAGATLAENGEFTKQAFINGKISLDEAESVIDMINATSSSELKASSKILKGELFKKINLLQQDIKDAIINLEVSIDYPEHDDETLGIEHLEKVLQNCKNVLLELEKTASQGAIIKSGVNVAIVGKPNVGKSSLLNALLGEERAIVTSIKGTTRDTLKETITYNGIKINFIDTAGIHESIDEVESIGINRSKESIQQADIILAVFDASESLQEEDKQILNLCKDKTVINILNKNDIAQNKTGLCGIEISAKNAININKIKEEILNLAIKGKIDFSGLIITNARHLEAIKSAIEQINNALSACKIQTVDILDLLTKDIWKTLGKITGETENEDIISGIFAKFCLGK